MSDSALWTDDLMNAMRQTGDPLADAVVSELFADGDVSQVNTLMRKLTVNEFVEPADVLPIVADYLRQTQSLPRLGRPRPDQSRRKRLLALWARDDIDLDLLLPSLLLSGAQRRSCPGTDLASDEQSHAPRPGDGTNGS